ncbi:hypothetical protein ACFPOB_26210 [Bosea eneae]|uniref:Uncharacterized protein n=1 Tax=Bosea eneae TaxID=151454 RepID=A0ABW0J0Z6_9HYPH
MFDTELRVLRREGQAVGFGFPDGFRLPSGRMLDAASVAVMKASGLVAVRTVPLTRLFIVVPACR